jgi:hypothetical protein
MRPLGDLGIDGKIMLKCILKKQGMWFQWQALVNTIVKFHKMEISSPDGQILSSHKGFC